MKTKAKLVLGLSILTAATLTAGATGTFAWFTTNRKAIATFNNITAKSVEGSLTIAMGALTDKNTTSVGKLDGDAATTEATLTGTNSGTTDVSSQDGITFAHPNWTDKAGNGNDVKGISDVSDLTNYGKRGYWTAYYIALKNNGGSPANVFIDQGSTITAATGTDDSQKAKNTAATTWTRVAINVAGVDTTPSVMPSAPKNTKLIQGSDMKNYVAPSKDAAQCNPIAVTNTILSELANVAQTVPGNDSAQWLATVASGATQYLVVSVWLEGTANNNQDSAIGGSVNVTLNFAALTAAGD